jgi:fumarate reductase subunit D
VEVNLTVKQKLIALLSYLAVLLFFPLNFFRTDDFAQYHARQGVVMFILGIAVVFTLWIPVAGWVCLLAYVVIWVTGIINVLTGKMEPVPVIGKIAERISL